MSLVFRSPSDFLDRSGQPLGQTGWLLIEQSRIKLFADATGDHQWIHVDPERARSGPFGACIAEGEKVGVAGDSIIVFEPERDEKTAFENELVP